MRMRCLTGSRGPSVNGAVGHARGHGAIDLDLRGDGLHRVRAESLTAQLLRAMVARLGLEPRRTAPEAVVLPLHHRAARNMSGEG